MKYIALSLSILLLASCVTTTAPDGTVTKSADPALTAAATAVAVEAINAYAAKKTVHPDK